MRKLLVLLVLSIVLVLGGCAFVPTVTYTEANDATNDVTPEVAGDLALGTLAIKGSFSSASDSDNYKVKVGTATTLSYDVLYNGTSQSNALGISLFPFSYTTYDVNGTVLMNYLFMAGLTSEPLDAGTSYIEFHFFGLSTYASGNYELDLK